MEDKTKVGKPISVKNLAELHLGERINQLAGNIIYNESSFAREEIKKELNLTQDQFETIIRKNPERIGLELLKGTENSIICKRYYFDNKYLFTLDVPFINNFNNESKTINITYNIYKEIEIKDLEILLDIDNE